VLEEVGRDEIQEDMGSIYIQISGDKCPSEVKKSKIWEGTIGTVRKTSNRTSVKKL
jgi:hypothetical protein